MTALMLCSLLITISSSQPQASKPSSTRDLEYTLNIHTSPIMPTRGGWMPDGRLWFWDEQWLCVGKNRSWKTSRITVGFSSQSLFHSLNNGHFIHQNFIVPLGIMGLAGQFDLTKVATLTRLSILNEEGEIVGTRGDDSHIAIDLNSKGDLLMFDVATKTLQLKNSKKTVPLSGEGWRAAFGSLTEEGHCYGSVLRGATSAESKLFPAVFDGKEVKRLPLPDNFAAGIVTAYRSPSLCAGIVFPYPEKGSLLPSTRAENIRVVVWRDGVPTVLEEAEERLKEVTPVPEAVLPDASVVGAIGDLNDNSLRDIWHTRGSALDWQWVPSMDLWKDYLVKDLIGVREDGALLLWGYKIRPLAGPYVFELVPKRQ